jgi:hypothetical protein
MLSDLYYVQHSKVVRRTKNFLETLVSTVRILMCEGTGEHAILSMDAITQQYYIRIKQDMVEDNKKHDNKHFNESEQLIIDFGNT